MPPEKTGFAAGVVPPVASRPTICETLRSQHLDSLPRAPSDVLPSYQFPRCLYDILHLGHGVVFQISVVGDGDI